MEAPSGEGRVRRRRWRPLRWRNLLFVFRGRVRHLARNSTGDRLERVWRRGRASIRVKMLETGRSRRVESGGEQVAAPGIHQRPNEQGAALDLAGVVIHKSNLLAADQLCVPRTNVMSQHFHQNYVNLLLSEHCLEEVTIYPAASVQILQTSSSWTGRGGCPCPLRDEVDNLVSCVGSKYSVV